MNFFQSISEMQIQGDLTLTITKGTAGNLIVSIMLNTAQCGDNAARLIPPMNLNATAQELDEGFFAAIKEPIQKTGQLLTNMEGYLKALETAKQQSAMEKDNLTKAEKAKTEKQSKYEALMKKADELEAEGKPREAWMKVPEPSEYPEYADTLRSRREALSAQFAPSLFNS